MVLEKYLCRDIVGIIDKMVYLSNYQDVLKELKYSSEIWIVPGLLDRVNIHIMTRKLNGKIVPFYKLYYGEIEKKGYTDLKYINDDDLWDNMYGKNEQEFDLCDSTHVLDIVMFLE